VTNGSAPPPQELELKAVDLSQSTVLADKASSCKIMIRAPDAARVLQCDSAAGQQRWLQHLRAVSQGSAAARAHKVAQDAAVEGSILKMRDNGGCGRLFDEKVKKLREEAGVLGGVKAFYVADMQSMVEIEDVCSLYSGDARLPACPFSCAPSPLPGDVYVFIKIKSSPSGPVPLVFLWKGCHSSPAPLLAWSRS
jgi:hypothetical protein